MVFLLKAGLEFNDEVLEKLKQEALEHSRVRALSFPKDDNEYPYSFYRNEPCGDDSSTIQKRLIVFAHIPLKTKLFKFKTDIANYRNKELKDEIVVRLGFWM